MRDFDGDELIEGWYWMSSNEESDIFYPVYYNSSIDEFRIDNDWHPSSEIAPLNFHKAIMPVV